VAKPVSVYELSNGEILVWREEGGAICLKVHTRRDAPVGMDEAQALDLAGLLTCLARNGRG
jgi:hypothetical protein